MGASIPSDHVGAAVTGTRKALVVCSGHFWRRDDSRHVQRYRCKICKRTFCPTTGKDTWRLHLRRYSHDIMVRLAHKGSQRGIARALGIDRSTVAHRTRMYGLRAEAYFRGMNVSNLRHVQFDDMQSSVHTKCKPVSMPLAVCAQTRKILYLDACIMPAQHPLKEISERKYGPRADERPEVTEKAMRHLRPMIAQGGQITTDRATRYFEPIARILTGVSHIAFKSRKARIGGQGELKKIGFDPLFPINHTAAMFRDGVSRLIRKTWCNSKRLDMLRWHMLLYAKYYNEVILRGT
jgi:transposase-like protein